MLQDFLLLFKDWNGITERSHPMLETLERRNQRICSSLPSAGRPLWGRVHTKSSAAKVSQFMSSGHDIRSRKRPIVKRSRIQCCKQIAAMQNWNKVTRNIQSECFTSVSIVVLCWQAEITHSDWLKIVMWLLLLHIWYLGWIQTLRQRQQFLFHYALWLYTK